MNLRAQMEFMRMMANNYAFKAEQADNPPTKAAAKAMERDCREVYESLVVLDNVCRQTQYLQSA